MDVQLLKNKLARLLSAQPSEKVSKSEDPVVYLHIGMPKTGTTAIQRFLYENRAALLEKQGCLYPDYAMGWFQQVPLVKAIVRPVFPDAIFNKSITDIETGDWMTALEEQCHAAKCRKVIVSSEFLWAAPAMQTHLKFHDDTDENFAYIEDVVASVKNTFSRFNDVKIIVYLRRQDTWLESFFNQQIKIGAVIPPEDAVMEVKNYLLYAKNLKLWQKYFGSEQVIVRYYEETASDIINDFCKVTGIDGNSLNSPHNHSSEIANPSLSPRAVRIMRQAIDQKMGPDFLERLRIVLTSTAAVSMGKGKRPRYSVFSKQFHDQVLDHYLRDTKELVEMYPESAFYLERNVSPENPSRQQEEQDYRWEEQVELILEDLMLGKSNVEPQKQVGQ